MVLILSVAACTELVRYYGRTGPREDFFHLQAYEAGAYSSSPLHFHCCDKIYMICFPQTLMTLPQQPKNAKVAKSAIPAKVDDPEAKLDNNSHVQRKLISSKQPIYVCLFTLANADSASILLSVCLGISDI